jgi:hypothetical protein
MHNSSVARAYCCDVTHGSSLCALCSIEHSASHHRMCMLVYTCGMVPLDISYCAFCTSTLIQQVAAATSAITAVADDAILYTVPITLNGVAAVYEVVRGKTPVELAQVHAEHVNCTHYCLTSHITAYANQQCPEMLQLVSSCSLSVPTLAMVAQCQTHQRAACSMQQQMVQCSCISCAIVIFSRIRSCVRDQNMMLLVVALVQWMTVLRS